MIVLATAFALLTPMPPAADGGAPIAPAARMARPPAHDGAVRGHVPPLTKGPPRPHIYGPRDLKLPLIMIDPGHGGHDPGARNNKVGVTEKDVTLAIAIRLRDELLKSGRVRVALTREDDAFLALEERYTLGRDLDAALFLSIHADASEDMGAHGATLYTLSDTPSDAEAARLAARENRANLLGGVDLSDKSSAVSSILLDLTRRETLATSIRFADMLHRETAAQLSYRTPWQRRAALVVLRAPDIPSILFETGYISNGDEAARLISPDGQQTIARGTARAIAIFAATRNKASGPAALP